MLPETVPQAPRIPVEFKRVLGRRIKQPITQGKPEGGYRCPVHACPQKLRWRMPIARSALKPIGFEACQLEQLLHLRVMTKSIDRPARGYVHIERLPEVTLAIQDLPDPRLSAGNIAIQHHVRSTNNLQPALRNEVAKISSFLRISFQKRLDVRGLVQHEAIIRNSAQQTKRLLNIGQIVFQVVFTRLEDGALPMGMGDHPEDGPI